MEEIGKYHNGSAGHQNDYHNTAGTTPFAKIQNREQEKEKMRDVVELGVLNSSSAKPGFQINEMIRQILLKKF